MEPGICIIYYCYGLQIECYGESVVEEKIKYIKEKSKGEAGEDGRKMKFVAAIPASDMQSAIGNLIKKAL